MTAHSPSIARILLIDVEAGGGQLTGRWSHHPLGLMYLAAAARRAMPALEIRLFHTATAIDPDAALTALLAEFRPEIVGLRSLSIARDNFSRICQLVRQCLPAAVILGGGPYSSTSFEEILERREVDLVVVGEGEATFVELLQEYNRLGRLPSGLSGTAERIADKVRLNTPRPLIPDLDSIAWPAYDLIKFSDYEGISNHAFQQADRSAFIESSRGCPYRCFYCHIAREKTTRNRSPQSVVDEIKHIHQTYGIDDFVFVDDIFNVPRKNGKETLRLLIEQVPGVRVNFPNGLRADQLDMEYMELFEAAGTTHMALAVETASPRLQKLIGKNLKLDHAAEMIHEASKRFVVCGFFMVGFPTETRAEAEATLEFARNMTFLAQPVLSIVRVYERTVLWDVLAPTPDQAGQMRDQASAMLQPKLRGETTFYGDYFDDERVPLKSADIADMREQWVSQVLLNPARIKNSTTVMERHFTRQQMITFYKNLFDKEKFGERDLSDLLAWAAR